MQGIKNYLASGKQRLFFAGIFGLLVLLIILGLIFSSRPRQAQWQDYSSSLLGVSLSHPAGWSVQEEAAESGPDILLLETNGSAFVRIRGFVDPYLDSKEAISSSIAEYQTSLALQDGVSISDFQINDIKDDIGGFWLAGEFEVLGSTYRFEEYGWLSMAGQVLILRAADIPQDFDESLPEMKKIMNSFVIQ